MKQRTRGALLAILLAPSVALPGSLGPRAPLTGCVNGVATGNKHCNPKAGVVPVSLTDLAGAENPAISNPLPWLGSILPDIQNVILIPVPQTPMAIPPQPPAQQVPTPMVAIAPPQVLAPQRAPMAIPPQPPAQQVPTPIAVIAPPQVLPLQQAPMAVPPQPSMQPPPGFPSGGSPTNRPEAQNPAHTDTPPSGAVDSPRPQDLILVPVQQSTVKPSPGYAGQRAPIAIPQSQPMQVPVPVPSPAYAGQQAPVAVPPGQAMQTPVLVPSPGYAGQQAPIAIPQSQPMQVPVPVPSPGYVGQQAPIAIPQSHPMQVPVPVPSPGYASQQAPIAIPQSQAMQVPVPVPPPDYAGQQAPIAIPQLQVLPQQQVQGPIHVGTPIVPDNGQRYALIVYAADTPQPVTSGRYEGASAYTLEFIEPGLQNRKVKVYRTRDSAEQVYKDTIPLDKGGLQLIVVGTRNPSYIH